jgi:hypothetical protein
MLAPPDPLRQRWSDLSAVIAAGDAVFLTFEGYGSGFDGRSPDRMVPLEEQFNTWYATALAGLSAHDRSVVEQICAEPTAPPMGGHHHLRATDTSRRIEYVQRTIEPFL